MIGSTLSHFKINAKLGEGGMGEVYRAEDLHLKRPVALKVLPGDMAKDPERLRRFQREAELVASLSHPGIVTIFSVEEAEGVRFLTMELVTGRTLADLVPPGGMDLDHFFDLALQLAEALVAAHDKGVTHRDLKPANIMVTREGQVKVLDFGLAKLRQGDEDLDQTQMATEALTREGLVLGTIPYMSPEQLEGRPIDHRTDIFSVGIILHEMLTGERPFKGASSASLVSAILRDPPPSVSQIRATVPPGLGRLIQRCLQKDPDRRCQTAKDLRNQLEELVGKPVEETGGRPRSIAVLPFADMSPQKDQDYFCEGIAEDIINALAKIRNLRVAPRISAFKFKDPAVELSEIGERLDVESVLSGSVRKAGQRVRISAELVNLRDGHQLWSERYDRDLEDVFEVQDEISQNIVEALEVTLSPKERKAIKRQAPVDIHAYEYYLRGRSLFHSFLRQSHKRALQMYSRAIEIDPQFAAAHAGIADLSSYAYMYFGKSEEDLNRADQASQRALDLAPELAEAYASRGLALSLLNRYEEAVEAFKKAIRLDPQLFEAHYFYARACFQEGELKEAAGHFERALEVRPQDYQSAALLASIYAGLEGPEAAEKYHKLAAELCSKRLELEPQDARALYLGAGAHVALGEVERGLEWADKAVTIDPNDTGILYNVACAYAQVGRVDQAIDYLAQAVAAGFSQKEWIVNDSDLDPLRDHPRYQELLDGMG